jgi:hypothetical protein
VGLRQRFTSIELLRDLNERELLKQAQQSNQTPLLAGL